MGRLQAIGYETGEILARDYNRSIFFSQVKQAQPIVTLSWNCRSEWIISTISNGRIGLWDPLEPNSCKYFSTGMKFWSMKTSFIDPELILFSTRSGDVVTYDLSKQSTVKNYPGIHKGSPASVAFSKGNYKLFASGGVDSLLHIYDKTQELPVLSWEALEHITAIDFSLDGKKLVLGCANGTVFVYDLRKPARSFLKMQGHSSAILDLITKETHHFCQLSKEESGPLAARNEIKEKDASKSQEKAKTRNSAEAMKEEQKRDEGGGSRSQNSFVLNEREDKMKSSKEESGDFGFPNKSEGSNDSDADWEFGKVSMKAKVETIDIDFPSDQKQQTQVPNQHQNDKRQGNIDSEVLKEVSSENRTQEAQGGKGVQEVSRILEEGVKAMEEIIKSSFKKKLWEKVNNFHSIANNMRQNASETKINLETILNKCKDLEKSNEELRNRIKALRNQSENQPDQRSFIQLRDRADTQSSF